MSQPSSGQGLVTMCCCYHAQHMICSDVSLLLGKLCIGILSVTLLVACLREAHAHHPSLASAARVHTAMHTMLTMHPVHALHSHGTHTHATHAVR